MGTALSSWFEKVRVVLDTNTVISALLFARGRLSWLRPVWTDGRIVPLVCATTTRELIDALAYPKFKLEEDDIKVLLAAYLPFAEVVDVKDSVHLKLPVCRDPDDQKFLRLAASGGAEVLVSGDGAILELRDSVAFIIEMPAEFRKRFD